MAHQKPAASTSAKILYRPVGIAGSIIAGLAASAVYKKVWARAAPSSDGSTPDPLQSEYAMRTVLTAALVQGAIYGVVKAATQRGGARLFERATGEWPGK